MERETIACHPANYGGMRIEPIRYIVVHYTAGNGDTARNNGLYFQRVGGLGASAHWFVDEGEAILSVPETSVAWHCGGQVYLHPACRNENSLGVELCSRQDETGAYFFSDATVENGAKLISELMKTYDVPVENVLRHYDVTGKKCPAPWVETGAWEVFRDMLKRYQDAESVPQWAEGTIRKLMERKILQGDGQGLDLSHDMVRMLVMLDRAGLFA